MKPIPMQPKFVRQREEKTKKKSIKPAQRRMEAPAERLAGVPATPHLELYQREDCPFSHAVRNRLSQLGLDYVAHTVPEGKGALKHEQLVHAGGKDQIPLLIDHKTGVRLYDSAKIIAYLDHEYGQPKAGAFNRWAKDLDLRIRTRADQLAWAIRTPFERAGFLVDDLSDGWNTLKHSYRVVKKVVKAPVTEKEKEKKKAA